MVIPSWSGTTVHLSSPPIKPRIQVVEVHLCPVGCFVSTETGVFAWKENLFPTGRAFALLVSLYGCVLLGGRVDRDDTIQEPPYHRGCHLRSRLAKVGPPRSRNAGQHYTPDLHSLFGHVQMAIDAKML